MKIITCERPGGHERNDRFESAQMTASRHEKGLIRHCLQKTVLQPISGMTAVSAPRPSWALLAEVRACLEIARSEGQRTGAETRANRGTMGYDIEPGASRCAPGDAGPGRAG